jgi:PHD/YefM family antitoxin component YafN of YafNO toxin-antitoxin module
MARIVRRIPITKARINLGQVARRAHVNREYFILEKDGIPVAGILSADELEDYLEMQEPGLKAQIRKSAAEYRSGRSRTAEAFLAGLRRPPENPPDQRTWAKRSFFLLTTHHPLLTFLFHTFPQP